MTAHLDLPPALTVPAGAEQPAGRTERLFRWAAGHPADLATLAACVLITAWRFRILREGGEPSGIDFGNWLTFGHAWLGHPVLNGTESIYPPVIPVLATLVTQMLGVAHADWVLASLLGLVPGVGVYAVLRAARRGWWAVLLSVPVMAGTASGEAVAWGGLPQLLGLGLAAGCVWVTARLVAERTTRLAWTLSALLLALGATSHLLLAQTVPAISLTFLAFALTHLTRPRDWAMLGRRGWITIGARVAVLPMLLAPLYWKLLHTVGQSFVSQEPETLGSIVKATTSVFREAPLVWRTALLISLAAPVLTWTARRTPLWRCATGLWASEISLIVLHPAERLVYLLPLCASIGLALLFPSSESGEQPAPAHERDDGDGLLSAPVLLMMSFVLLCSYSTVSSLKAFTAQHQFYSLHAVPTGTVEGLTWLRDRTPASALVATAPERGIPFGWWVEGYSRRATLVGAAQDFLNFPEERRRAGEADQLFNDPNLFGPSNLAAARRAGVDYLVVPAAWEGLDSLTFQELVDDSPDVVFQNDAMVIAAVPRLPARTR